MADDEQAPPPPQQQQEEENYRSVTDYDTEDALRKALLTSANCGSAEILDWVLPVMDPETTEPQSMRSL